MVEIFDVHFHIVGRNHKIVENQGYRPDLFEVEDYLSWFKDVKLLGGIFVAGSFHGDDWEGIVETLDRLGEGFYGVINARADLSRYLVEDLHGRGIRGVRFNVRRLGEEVLKDLEKVAFRIWEWAGWHVDLYIENRVLGRYVALLKDLPAVCIDHMGITLEGFDHLLELAESGVRVKVSGFGRLEFDPVWALGRILEVNPSSPMFGTDLPSTRASKPFSWDDLRLLGDLADRRLLVENALNFLGGAV